MQAVERDGGAGCGGQSRAGARQGLARRKLAACRRPRASRRDRNRRAARGVSFFVRLEPPTCEVQHTNKNPVCRRVRAQARGRAEASLAPCCASPERRLELGDATPVSARPLLVLDLNGVLCDRGAFGGRQRPTTGRDLHFRWSLRVVETSVRGFVTIESVLESHRTRARVRWNSRSSGSDMKRTVVTSRERNANRGTVRWG